MQSTVEVSATTRNAVVTCPVFSLREAAGYLHTSIGWVRQQVYAGNLPYVMLAGKYMIPRSEVEGFVKRGLRRNGK